ncbi:MAG: DUF177 domain-containing protein [Deltaproteobacteria bacterium]|nr:DUF177 domain-containing protein [Deltaproteobacteria bacterium]
MEQVRDNLVFSLEGWPEVGQECDFAIPPNVMAEALDLGEEGGEAPRLLTSVRGRMRLQLVSWKLKITGFFACKAEMVCDRCLTSFAGRLDDKFEETVRLYEPGSEDESQMTPEALETAVPVVNQKFDLTPLLGEFFLLALPYKTLCQPDCAGLCPECGANLNEAPCECRGSKPTKH